MADWSVEEQVISVGTEASIQSITLRVGHPDTSIMIMELRADPDVYLLRFNRNGGSLGVEKVTPPEVEEPPAKAAAEDEDDEPHPTPAAKRRRY